MLDWRSRGCGFKPHRSHCLVSLSKTLNPLHTGYTSHCEIKSHRIWLFRKPIPIRFSNLTEFSDHLRNTFYKEIIINHTFFLVILGGFGVIFVKISQNFIKSPLKFLYISQISVHSLWHVCFCLVQIKPRKTRPDND